MASRDHCVALIEATPTGEVSVRASAVGLARGLAMTTATDLALDCARIAFSGSPRLRTLTVRCPPTVTGIGRISGPALNRHLTAWLDYLRATGALRLDRFNAPGDIQSIPPECVADPIVQAALGIVLSSAPAAEDPDAGDALAWLKRAPLRSIGGLMRQQTKRADFLSWFEGVPPEARRGLRLRLCDSSSWAGTDWRVGCLRRIDHFHPFIAGEALVLDIAGRSVRCWTHPVLHTGWSLPRGEPVATDPAWTQQTNLALDRWFRPLPQLAESAFTRAASAAIDAGFDASMKIEEMMPLRRWTEQRLLDMEAGHIAEVQRRTSTTGLRRPRLTHAVYLRSPDDPAVAAQRQQALALWPALADDLAGGGTPAAASAIDAGRPLAPALAADWGVPVWAARRTLAILRGRVVRLRELAGPKVLATLVAAAGEHAPRLTAKGIEVVAYWHRLPPGTAGDPTSLLLMQALGAEAARHGWERLEEMAIADDAGDQGMQLLAWWDDLRANVREVLRQAGHAGDPAEVEAVTSRWLADLPMSTVLRLAAGWHRFLWDEGEPFALEEDATEWPVVFGPLTLLESRAEATPLASRKALKDEGADMAHCVGSYWKAVASARRLVVSLRHPAQGRVTGAWYRDGEGRWKREQLKGPRNIAVDPDSPLGRAGTELEALLADEGSLEPVALARHHQAAMDRETRAADHAVQGECLLATLPPLLARAALRWLPGSGPLERRILRNLPGQSVGERAG